MTSTAGFLSLFYDLDEKISFRAIPPKGCTGLTVKEYGSIHALQNGAGLRKKLEVLNRDHGIYFVVNHGGDCDVDIDRPNACFCESDNHTIAEQHAMLDVCPLPTTLRVETARSVHAYWKLAGSVPLESWTETQVRLIAFFGGDPAIKNASRVMRVPGFDHIAKDRTRTLVRCVQFEPGHVYTIAEMLAAFPAAKTECRKVNAAAKTLGGYATWDALRAELGRRIMAHDTARENHAGNWDCRGLCHGGEGNTGLFYTPANNQAHCNSRCEQAVILRAFGLPDRPEQGDSTSPTSARRELIGPPEKENSSDEPRPTQYSDDAVADLFTRQYGHDFLFVDSWGWLRWTSQRWQRVSDVVVMGYARQVCRQQSETCKEDEDISPKVRAGLARSLASAKVVAAVVRLAATDTRHYREASQFDKDLWLFNTPGGTIDLKTGELRPHRREDLITKIANATPQGQCPQWLAFLQRITEGSKELQAYLQRLAGYSLAGDPSEECIDFCYGEGGNGKGTFLKTLQYIFGEYSTTAQTETFLESKGDRHPTDIAKLAGARLVVAQEVDEGQHWNEVRLKTLTGRDEMTARFMRRDLFDFTPQFTLIISGNNKPALKTVDEAWRRRFHLVPFDVCIPKAEQNPNLKTELQAEADGILNWCLAGCLDWQQQRLNPPEAVLAATAEYLEGEDTFAMWLEDCCLRGHEGYEERKALAFTSHRSWKQDRGERAPGMKTFSQRMQKHGFPVGQETSGDRARVFKGVRLTDDERQKAKAAIEKQKMRERGADPREREDYFG